MFLGKGVLKICRKFTGEHTCRTVISIKLQSNFIETTFRHGYSPVNLLHISRKRFYKNTSRGLLLTNREQVTSPITRKRSENLQSRICRHKARKVTANEVNVKHSSRP